MGAAPRLAARLVFALLLLRAFPRPGAPTAAFRDPLLRALTRTGLSFCLARPVDQRSSLGTSTPYPLHYLTLLFESWCSSALPSTSASSLPPPAAESTQKGKSRSIEMAAFLLSQKIRAEPNGTGGGPPFQRTYS